MTDELVNHSQEYKDLAEERDKLELALCTALEAKVAAEQQAHAEHLATYERALSSIRWTKVYDAAPEVDVRVLVLTEQNFITISKLSPDGTWKDKGLSHITHWMPLPHDPN